MPPSASRVPCRGDTPLRLTSQTGAARRATLIAALLGAAAAIGSIWLYDSQSGSRVDPWPAAIEEVSAIVRGTDLKVAAAAAQKAAQPVAFLEHAKPLLDRIDAWRGVTIAGNGKSSGAGDNETFGVPNNVYDGIVLALDYVVSGTATALRSLETVVRRASGARDALRGIGGELNEAERQFRAFEEEPSRTGAEALAAYRSQFDSKVAPLRRDIESWQEDVGRLSDGVKTVRNATKEAADTIIGRYVAAQLESLDGLIAKVGVPLAEYQGEQANVLRAVDDTGARLQRIKEIVDAAAMADLESSGIAARGGSAVPRLLMTAAAVMLLVVVISYLAVNRYRLARQ